MSTFLVNATNLKTGGGLQVAQSLCDRLGHFTQHRFIVALSSYIDDKNIKFGDNVEVVRYNIGHGLWILLTGRDSFLDGIVKANGVDAVLTVFGPSIWRPRVKHLCGFARAQLLLSNPNRETGFGLQEIKQRLTYAIWEWGFRRSGNTFYTENPYISKLLRKLLGKAKIYTVTNYYHQVFDTPEKWQRKVTLPQFDGVTCLSVSTNASHKNFPIIIDVIREMREIDGDFKVRFVLTFDEKEMKVPEDVRDRFVFVGKVDVSECPYLYEQSDIMFMPTLLECFTATYPEAMRMDVPIVTTDSEFARGLCGEAACYYSAVDAKAAAEAVYKVATDADYRLKLTDYGREQLKKFDNYNQRAEKLVRILEGL